MKALVVIPTYNERENIGPILAAIWKEAEVDILVIDDNSPDKTADVVRQINNPKLHLLSRPAKLGLGSAYVEGFRWALAHGYEAAVEMDADFSHDPKDVVRLLKALENSDVVVGSRYGKGGGIENWSWPRQMLSCAANIYARALTGVPIQDLTSGFVAWHKRALEGLDLNSIQSDGYAFQIETKTLAFRNAYCLTEIPIVFTERREGKSKMSSGIAWEAFWIVLGLFFKKK